MNGKDGVCAGFASPAEAPFVDRRSCLLETVDEAVRVHRQLGRNGVAGQRRVEIAVLECDDVDLARLDGYGSGSSRSLLRPRSSSRLASNSSATPSLVGISYVSEASDEGHLLSGAIIGSIG